MSNLTADMMTNKVAFLNGVAHNIIADESVLDFSRRLEQNKQYDIPTLCDDTRLDAYGSCRVCSVDIALSADGPRKVMASCHTPISDGMHIFTNSTRVEKLRKNIVELVLSDHPDNCEECPSNNYCELQDVAVATGVREIRFGNAEVVVSKVVIPYRK